MSFNLDDPLAGILSDGSDDSFFDDDILGKKKPPKAKQIAEKKNALFDLQEPKVQSTDVKLDNRDIFSSKQELAENELNLGQKKSPIPFKRTISKESIKFPQSELASKVHIEKTDINKSPAKPKAKVDKSNIINELSADTKKDSTKPLERGKSSQSILDDILGSTSSKTGTSNPSTRPATAVKKQEFDFDSILGSSESKQTKSSKLEPNKSSLKSENAKDPLKLKKAKSNDDWLGIFQEDTIEEENDDDIPAWLEGGNKKKKSVNEPKKESKSHNEENLQAKIETVDGSHVVPKIDKVDTSAEHVMTTLKLDVDQDLTLEGATLYLQQQESQLMVAMQLKAQDEKLAAMQLRQKESQRVQQVATLAQHEQIDSLLRRQAEQRQQMQNIIAAHQERITQRIKALLGDNNNDHEEIHDYPNEYGNSDEKKESPFAKERNQLLQLVRSLQENHDKEIDIMETSYRRQLAFLEISFTQAEERMKEESDKLIKFYTEKITWLDEHHQLYKKMTEENLNSLTERYKAENDMLKQQHLDNVRILQEHHAALMENIKNAVKQEQVLIKDSAGFSSNLHDLLTNVKDGNEKCEVLYAKVDTLLQNTQRDSDKSLQTRETQINEMIGQLKIEREHFEKEKSENKDIVNTLEARLKQMTSMIEEESVSLKQRKMEFEFEKATFSKQTEFAKNVLKKQDEEIKMLKEDIQKEYQEKITKVEDDRAKILKESALVAKEKASIQSLKLELEKTKVELQAQLEEMAGERAKINSEKQELHMEEQRVISKSRDLDLLAKTAMEKQSQADKKYSEAEFLQRKYEDRIRRIQEHVVSLNSREKQIAKEKVALSRERLSLHNERKEIETRQQCSLCRSSQQNTEYAYVPSYNLPVSRDYGTLRSPVNMIEAEMSQLMNRVKLRPDVNLDREDDREEAGPFKDYMDPRLMMLRLDVQQVIGNLAQTKKEEAGTNEDQE